MLALDDQSFQGFLQRCRSRGVFVKWFGHREAQGYTSLSSQWRYLSDPHTPPATLATLERLCDMRIPLDLPLAACDAIVEVVAEALRDA